MTTRIFVPGDVAALAVGADKVARALASEAAARGMDIEIVRNGSRGMFWLEPLVEVETAGGRVGYGPIEPEDVPRLFEAGFLELPPGVKLRNPKALGLVANHPWLSRQSRLTFARCGIVDPRSLRDYCAFGGLRGLYRAVEIGPRAVIDEISASGLRGRGGAGFPTGLKWKTVADTPADRRYIVCNADEGDSGTFADRMVMEGDPFCLIEGMMIAGWAVGATQGYVYSRSEYPHANAMLGAAIATARKAGLLGNNVLGAGFGFDIELRVGAGAYVCGEETALLESLEGKRGVVRAKPPLPAHKGLFGRPTAINNLLSLATIPVILAEGADHYAAYGMGRSRGTMPIQIAGNVRQGGLFEAGFGLTLGEIVEEIGGGTASGRPIRAVQCGGPLGAYFPRALFDTRYDYEAFAARDGLIGHGGIVVFDDSVDLAKQARFAMEFCAIQSCGKCTPCRIGSTRGVEVIDRIIKGERRVENIAVLEDLCQTMKLGSLCALGGFTPYPVLSALRHFTVDFGAVPGPTGGEAARPVEAALIGASIVGRNTAEHAVPMSRHHAPAAE